MQDRQKKSYRHKQRNRLFSIEVAIVQSTSNSKQKFSFSRPKNYRNAANRLSLLNKPSKMQDYENDGRQVVTNKENLTLYRQKYKMGNKKHRFLYKGSETKRLCNKSQEQADGKIQKQRIFIQYLPGNRNQLSKKKKNNDEIICLTKRSDSDVANNQKYFVKNRKKDTIPAKKAMKDYEKSKNRKNVRRSHKKSHSFNPNIQTIDNNIESANKISILSQRSQATQLTHRKHRMHTIDQICDEQTADYEEGQVVRIQVSLKHLLSDIANNHKTSRKRVNTSIKSQKQLISYNKNLNKNCYMKRSLKTQAQKNNQIIEIRQDQFQDDYPEISHNKIIDNNNQYECQQNKVKKYRKKQYQLQQPVLKQNQKLSTGVKNQKAKKALKTEAEQIFQINHQQKQNKNDKRFKSYLEFINNKKRDNNLYLLKKIRNNEASTSKIQETLDLLKLKNNRQNTYGQKFNKEQDLAKDVEFMCNKNQISQIEKINESSFLSECTKKILRNQQNILAKPNIQNSITTEQFILKKIGGEKSPITHKKQRKQRKLTNFSGGKQVFPERFFQ